MKKRLTTLFVIGAVACTLVVLFNPVNATLYKVLLMGCVGIAWTGIAMLVWKRRFWRILVLALPFVVAIPFVLPGREINLAELRDDYVHRLVEFEETEYFWGGESARGIDCSGLPRRAFRDALLSYGIRTFNGDACRSFLEHWWYDASAKALGEGYRTYTTPLGVEGTIQTMEYGELQPGDIAVTKTGIHALVYLGDSKWIQAEPGIGAVVTLDGREDRNLWFESPVGIHRWQLLTATKP